MMTTIKTKDGARLYCKDWGTGQLVVFSHSWPLSADAWNAQITFLGQHGYHVIARDRRGQGRSDQTWEANDMDTYADDKEERRQQFHVWSDATGVQLAA